MQVYSGTGTSKAISGKGSGTYYYRVRACNGSGCSGYIAGANPTVVNVPGVPSSISVPSSSSTGNYTISWGAASGSVTRYELYEATNASFSGQVLTYSGTSRSKGISGKDTGTYYYRVRACNSSVCSAYRTGTNAIAVSAPIQVLNPAIEVSCCTTTSISALADLNGNAATIQSFSESCTKASVAIQSGAQSVTWTNNNTFTKRCEIGVVQHCSASYVIRKSSTGQLYSGTASIDVLAQGISLPPGHSCP